jgi:hypothetical protein
MVSTGWVISVYITNKGRAPVSIDGSSIFSGVFPFMLLIFAVG